MSMEDNLAKQSTEETVIRMLEEIHAMLIEQHGVIGGFAARLDRIEHKLDALNEKASRILGLGADLAEEHTPPPRGGSNRQH